MLKAFSQHAFGLFSIFTLLIFVSGCGSMKIEDFKDNKPTLVLEEYFLGETTAWGMFEDRFGNLKRSFKVEITGTIESGVLTLDERFEYNDGHKERRVWRIKSKGNGYYEGEAGDVVGIASGQVVGNALNWKYKLDLPIGDTVWRVRFNDWMFLLSDGVLVNKAEVTKWGLHLGTVTLFFNKPNSDKGSQT